MNVHIIGLPSAGKTSLATALALHLGAVHHDLDRVAFVDDRWTPRPSPERAAAIAQILDEEVFVTDGVFLGWTEPLFAAADHIVWLDPPLRVLLGRHLCRFASPGLGWLVGRIRFLVLSYLRPPGSGPAIDDRNQTRSGIEVALRPFAGKVLCVRRSCTPDEVMAALNM